MIRSFPELDKMTFCHVWTSRLIVMTVLCLTLDAEDKTCENGIKVRRYTTYEAKLGEPLELLCPVRVCTEDIPTITWFKLEGDEKVKLNSSVQKTEETNTNEMTSFLIFNNVQSSDLGLYQCQLGNDQSHIINLSLRGDYVNGTVKEQNDTSSDVSTDRHVWLYLYTTAGIVGFVIIVTIISVLSLRGCSGKTKKVQSGNQYIDVPMVDQPVHHSSHQTLPRASPRGPPAHRASRRNKSSSAPPHNVYGQIEDVPYRDGPEEEESAVVYAALNHQHLATASPRPWTVTEERSEYAAIKVS
ncbi:B- and T-lymphocyte attenuator-like [Eucyclogobius newberryi]|uniref:B- and T-lymphocyte attenuator-like n=1 Tax=Eucyclogobius newberryi TaxID=166745 RepID=UPI003B5B4663